MKRKRRRMTRRASRTERNYREHDLIQIRVVHRWDEDDEEDE